MTYREAGGGRLTGIRWTCRLRASKFKQEEEDVQEADARIGTDRLWADMKQAYRRQTIIQVADNRQKRDM